MNAGQFVSRLTRKSRSNFFYAFLVLPRVQREAIYACYAFCRIVDDAVDLGQDRAAQRVELARWREEIARVYEGRAQHPAGQRLQVALRQFPIPRAALEEIIAGVEMDLDHPTYETWDALYPYCYRVASAVGLCCIEIFGYSDARAREYAVNLGVALQLTNIIRDVAADLRRGRVYLPAEDLQCFGVTVEDLQNGVVSPAVRRLLEFECARAREYYRRAAAQLPAGDARNLVAAEIMGAIYREILHRIERGGYDVFSRRVRVPRPRRAAIALRVWIAGRRPRE